jgi:hypothetical protein
LYSVEFILLTQNNTSEANLKPQGGQKWHRLKSSKYGDWGMGGFGSSLKTTAL